MTVRARPAARIPAGEARNPDHHIWCNNGTYFVHLTLLRGRRRIRVRKSLKTKDVDEARRRRDRMVAYIRERTPLRLIYR